jgi:hypothetical protein
MKTVLFLFLMMLTSCSKHKDSKFLPLEIGSQSFIIDRHGRKVSQNYTEMHTSHGEGVSGTVLTGANGVLVIDHKTNQVSKFKPQEPYSPLLYAALLRNNIVVLGRDGYLQDFYRNGDKIMQSTRFIPSANFSRILVKNEDQWALLNESLEKVKNLPNLNYRGTYDGVWATHSTNEGWGYFDLESGFSVSAEFHYASNVVPIAGSDGRGFCVVATEPGYFFAAMIDKNDFEISSGPYSSGGLWISADGHFTVVGDMITSKIGIININGDYIVHPRFDVFQIFNDSTILMRKEDDLYWMRFSHGKLNETKIPANTSIYDLGLGEYCLFETESHIGYLIMENFHSHPTGMHRFGG